MSTVDDNIKYGMIEAISHLIHRDYSAIVEDFVTLDFIPQGASARMSVLLKCLLATVVCSEHCQGEVLPASALASEPRCQWPLLHSSHVCVSAGGQPAC